MKKRNNSNLSLFFSNTSENVKLRDKKETNEIWDCFKKPIKEQERILKEYKESLERLKEVQEELILNLNEEGSNYTPFVREMISRDLSLSLFKSLKTVEKRELLNDLVEKYEIKKSNRKNMKFAFELLYDDGTSRRKSHNGTEKMQEIFESLGYSKYRKEVYQFEDTNFYIFPDKDGKKVFDSILEKEIVDFGFRDKKQGKYPDALVKRGHEIYIIEHKNIDESGGAQNKQVGELIDFIRFTPSKPHFHFVAYLTGFYGRKIMNPEQPKQKKQKDTIVRQLRQSPENYFLIGDGLKKII